MPVQAVVRGVQLAVGKPSVPGRPSGCVPLILTRNCRLFEPRKEGLCLFQPEPGGVVEAPAVTAPTAIEPVVPIVQADPVVEIPAPEVVVAENATVDASSEAKTEVAPVETAVQVDIDAALAESGLVMVQTTAQPVIVAAAEPPVKLGRPRKQRQVSDSADNEPLVMVETGK